MVWWCGKNRNTVGYGKNCGGEESCGCIARLVGGDCKIFIGERKRIYVVCFFFFLLSYLKAEYFDGKEKFEGFFHKIQTALFHVGAELATPSGKEVKWKLEESDIKELEEQIDFLDGTLTPLKNFILPGGHPAG
ncbi:ATP:cob(I)alamin adenosyltransferase, partial [Planococcus maritimus]|uniref:ATP:cob(I)alamin adenosyltransferase n=1 Tax=Planococcus maritimus TaxID=192421 RepID=UPI00209B9975